MITVVECKLEDGWQAWVDPAAKIIYVDPAVAPEDIPEIVRLSVAGLLEHQQRPGVEPPTLYLIHGGGTTPDRNVG